jgi:hypothetical protein
MNKSVFFRKNGLGIFKRANTALTMHWGGSGPIFFKDCTQQQPLYTTIINRSSSDEIRNEWYSYWPWSKTRITARTGTISCTFTFFTPTNTVTLSW